MAKRLNIEGTIYYPIKNHPLCQCSKCGRNTQKMVYAKGEKTSNEFYCRSCIANLLSEFQKQMKNRRYMFPIDEVIYIGTTGHKCEEGPKAFMPMIARFRCEKKYVDIPIVQCSYCKKFIMDGKQYEKNSERLKEYKKVRSRTGKEIKHYEFKSYGKNKIQSEIKKSEIPSSVRWAATHPYQGGDCCPK